MTLAYCRTCPTRCDACPRPQLLPSNLPIVEAFVACATQWRRDGFGRRTGLDYGGCQVALRTLLPPAVPAERRRVLRGLQVIERAIVQVDAEARAEA